MTTQQLGLLATLAIDSAGLVVMGHALGKPIIETRIAPLIFSKERLMQTNLIPGASTKQMLRRSTMDPFRKAEEAGSEYRRIRDATSSRGHTALYRFLGLIHHAYEFGEEHPAMLDRLAPLAHLLRMLVEPALHRLENMLVLPAGDAPLLAGRALLLDRTGAADIGPVAP